jgi:uncharacterized membrane protein YgdD (TMEM256/DUF423 family)
MRLGMAPRLCLGVAGLYGAAGVGLAAAASHMGEALLGPASLMLLVHAAALLGLALVTDRFASRLLGLSALLIGAGVFLFSGSLALHALADLRPVPMAAPAGGMLMIAGWLAAAAGALAGPRRRDSDTQIR